MIFRRDISKKLRKQTIKSTRDNYLKEINYILDKCNAESLKGERKCSIRISELMDGKINYEIGKIAYKLVYYFNVSTSLTAKIENGYKEDSILILW